MVQNVNQGLWGYAVKPGWGLTARCDGSKAYNALYFTDSSTDDGFCSKHRDQPCSSI